MSLQRFGLGAMRGTGQPGVFFNQSVPKLALARLLSQQARERPAIVHLNQKEGHDILVKQRLNRPVTPNLTIYKVGQVWFSASAWTRITGLAVGGTAYLTLCAHAVAPYMGMGFDSAALVSAFGALPFAAKVAIKFGLLGFPFTYHFINGIRHLVFDLGFGYKKAQFKKSEAATWILSVLGGLVLAFWI
ncbi:cytochrome b-large subunit [Fusarium mexicanum]|uniref:Cytochrome b-large subunit n=1 Tax=Fusarium mexicanum TaxID=751941 RepID=A0A8H5J115_9HYPO|nr:cytochrome b-large subunit [Fusarium mexicanum]